MRAVPAAAHPIGTPTKGLAPHTGPLAAAAWLVARDVMPDGPQWSVKYVFDADREATFELDEHATSTRFQLEIYAQEWGFVFRHGARVSWIRVTDIAFVHGRDDHGLLRETPNLRDVGALLRRLEHRFEVALPRESVLVQTSLVGAETVLRDWALRL